MADKLKKVWKIKKLWVADTGEVMVANGFAFRDSASYAAYMTNPNKSFTATRPVDRWEYHDGQHGKPDRRTKDNPFGEVKIHFGDEPV